MEMLPSFELCLINGKSSIKSRSSILGENVYCEPGAEEGYSPKLNLNFDMEVL